MLLLTVLERAETHTDPVTSNLKKEGCQERQETHLRRPALSTNHRLGKLQVFACGNGGL